MSKAIFINARIALFFSDPIKRPDLLLPQFNEKFSGIFDQPPLTVPIPDRPEFAQVPVVKITSSNGLHTANLARKRFDYFHYSSDKNKQFDFGQIKNDFLLNVKNLFEVCEAGGAVLDRVGFVAQFFWEASTPGVAVAGLLDKELVNIHGSNTRHAKVQYVGEVDFYSFKFNNSSIIERGETGLYEDGKENKKIGVLISRDFNSLPEKTSEYKGKFTSDNIKNFIEKAETFFALDKIESLLWKKST